jgi:hypothetical protein
MSLALGNVDQWMGEGCFWYARLGFRVKGVSGMPDDYGVKDEG